jgi:hypothetical protein
MRLCLKTLAQARERGISRDGKDGEAGKSSRFVDAAGRHQHGRAAEYRNGGHDPAAHRLGSQQPACQAGDDSQRHNRLA